MRTLRPIRILLLGVMVTLTGCPHDPVEIVTPRATFRPSPSLASPNRVRLEGVASGDEISLSVVLDGPTTVSDLFSFAFDVEISNPLVLSFVANSEGAGSFFNGVSHVLVVEAQGNRIICGISETGAGPGGTVSTAKATLLTFKVKTIGSGSSTLIFRGSPSNPSTPTTDPAALDSSGAVISAIQFDPASAEGSR